MVRKNISSRTIKMVQLSILVAIIFLMAFTPLGYLHVGLVAITFLVIPVAVGAIVLGPAAGAFLGAMFGITSFIQCFGMDPFGVILLGINPVFTFIMCMIPRILMGWLAGLIFKGLYRMDKTKLVSFGVASLSAALLNTLFFMTSLLLLFGNSSYIKDRMVELGTTNVFAFAVAFVGINGLIEAVVCGIVGFAVSKALVRFLPANHKTE